MSEGYADFRDYRTWYRVTGSLDADKAPLVVVHGGPGCTHDYLDSLTGLAATGRAVIHYDQLGNGRSTHLRDRGADFWTVDCSRKSWTTSSPTSASPTGTTSWVNRGAACSPPSTP